MEKKQIVLRAQTGKKQVSPDKTREIRAALAKHLGELKRGFESGDLNEDCIKNINETHFVIDFDTGRTLGFVGETSIKYTEVVSGEGMTMVVHLSGGPSAREHPPMMIFTNANASHPIQEVPDNIGSVCYRTGPRGWMDQQVFRQYLTEGEQSCGYQGAKKIAYLDNCGGHLKNEQCVGELVGLNARLSFLPANSTDLCQPADSFVIAKLKDIWSRKWNAKKLELINKNEWQDKVRSDENWSGKLNNPGKSYFSTLVAEVVQEFNTKRDKNGISYTRKAVIRYGMSLDVDGKWRIEQLTPQLQEIVKEFRAEFENKQ